MPGTRANFDDWRKLAVIEAWELAVLMHGFDPRALADIAVRNPDDPHDTYGVALDYMFELRQINGAAVAEQIQAATQPIDLTSPHTQIIVSSLGDWLATIGHADLAASLGLTGQSQSPQINPANAAILIPAPVDTAPTLPLRSPPKQRQAYQEEVVLEAIRAQGHDPRSLPKPSAGASGVKRAVRDAVAADAVFTGPTTFDKTWERLRQSGEIMDAP
jgi:hypothetical protein